MEKTLQEVILVTLLHKAQSTLSLTQRAEILRNAYLILGDASEPYQQWYGEIQKTMPAHFAIPSL